MNTEKRVNERIAKVALKNQEVNLGLAQDLLQEYKRAVDTFTDAQSTMDRALGMLKSAKKMYEDIEQKSKQLGVDVDSQIKKLGTNLDSFIKSASKR